MPLRPLSALAAHVFSFFPEGLPAKTCAEILMCGAQEFSLALRDLGERQWLYGPEGRDFCYSLTERGRKALPLENAWREAPNPFTDVVLALERGDAIESCSLLVEMINAHIDMSRLSCAVSLYDFVTRRLDRGDFPQSSEKTLRLALAVCDISMYLSKYHLRALNVARKAIAASDYKKDRFLVNILYLVEVSLENMAAECDEEKMIYLYKRCEAILNDIEYEYYGHMKYFMGMFQFWMGQFEDVLTSYEVACKSLPVWNCRFQTDLFALYTSSSAAYLGKFHEAIGILESANSEARIQQNRFKILWWEAQLAMILLYMGKDDDAIALIDHVLCAVSPENETKIALWAMRGLAYYQYRQGRILASYLCMRRQVETGIRYGTRRLIYSYPWLLEMLLSYEEEGLAPIAGMSVADEMRRAFRGYNEQLRASGLRAKAILLCREGGGAEMAEALLRDSQALFARLGNAFEARRTGWCLEVLRTRGRLCTRDLRAMLTPDQTFGPASAAVAACAAALPDSPDMSGFTACARTLVGTLCAELGAERGALLRMEPGGKLLLCAASHVGDSEKAAAVVQSRAAAFCTGTAMLPVVVEQDGGAVCCLPFQTPAGAWLLWLENRYLPAALLRLDTPCLLALRTTLEEWTGRAEAIPETPARHEDTQGLRLTAADGADTMIYASRAMKGLMRYCDRISATEAPVLILGETGVGKELLARYIHERSGRKGRFIPVHLASIPETLFESEFFGHEKGSFTSAHGRKTGIVEHADGGTLFIDEAGDIPPGVQTKLLRILQDRRFSRVGGDSVLFSNFRLICATNKDLWQEVRQERFREDLYYRISVVPVTIPPLRERPEDIPLLTRYYIERFSRAYNRAMPTFQESQMTRLTAHSWPGNVRELRSVIERAVIASQDGRLHFVTGQPGMRECAASPRVETPFAPFAAPGQEMPTMDEVQKQYLAFVLERTNGRISGPRGALAILGMKRSTVYHWLKKYGIHP